MAADSVHTVASAGQSAGRAMGDALNDAGSLVAKAAARTREEAEDIWAEAKDVAGKDSGQDAAVYVALGATAATGVVGLPMAAALGAGYAILRRRR
ncbi:MAG: hypothetical protein JO153_04370 [Solirubrobacterales bacterium]|nr:hypothetical protein [Solirubrobacterales bacterium]MBV9915716.1 hypothetical protein [Solirubrobacterales bacterium]